MPWHVLQRAACCPITFEKDPIKMKKKLLCAALFGGLSLAQVASAQEFDDRWYAAGSVGVNVQDDDRATEDSPFVTLGFGKFLTPNWSVDVELNFQHPDKTVSSDLYWKQYGGSIDARYHFRQPEARWWPYVRMGVGLQRHEEEFDAFPNPDSPGVRAGNGATVNLGAGLQFDLGRADLRTEIGARVEDDNDQFGPASDRSDYFVDYLASVGLTVAIGPEPTKAVGPAPTMPSATCADQDSDGDGVNDCDDKCPGSQAGQTIGPDGCAVPVAIDLKGVNFDFNKATLRPDGVAILGEAVQILNRYPELKAEVAGHTDLCGSDAYNQKLSERRATAVYEYLTKNGVDAARLSGPVGYGESRPLVQTEQTAPSCRNETNRRTELNVQN